MFSDPGAIHHAASKGRKSMVQTLVEANKNHLEERDNEGKSALMCAAEADQQYVVKYLLDEAGADFRVRDNEGGTALHAAAGSGALKALRVILDFMAANMDTDERNLLLDAVNRKGNTAMLEAVIKNKPDCVRALLVNGADPKIANNDKQTARDIAHFKRLTEVKAALKN